MQKNLYYHEVVGRRNIIKEAIFDFFLDLSSYPRMILETFFRDSMGERYYVMASAVTVWIILAAFPFVFAAGHHSSCWDIAKHNPTWYLLLAAYTYFMYKRYQEVKREPAVFYFNRYTRSDGNPVLKSFFSRIFGDNAKIVNIRTIDIWLEPLVATLAGLLLLLIGQFLTGMLLLICAGFYSISKSAMYYKGDQFILGIIESDHLQPGHA